MSVMLYLFVSTKYSRCNNEINYQYFTSKIILAQVKVNIIQWKHFCRVPELKWSLISQRTDIQWFMALGFPGLQVNPLHLEI